MGTVKQGWEGRFFEDFEVGDVYRGRYGRTVTEAFKLTPQERGELAWVYTYGSRLESERLAIVELKRSTDLTR